MEVENTEKESDWASLLGRLYGTEGILKDTESSVWWKDIQRIDGDCSWAPGWFSEATSLKIGDGRYANFWHDRWCCSWQLKELFPNLYEIADDRSISVAGASERTDNGWRWLLRWKRQLRPDEITDAELLDNMLASVSLERGVEDSWIWLKDKTRNYKVKTTYEDLVVRSNEAVRDDRKQKVLRRLWGTAAPSKSLVLAWRMLSDGLPTRVALKQRGVLDQSQGSSCVFCFREEEEIDHLFSAVMSLLQYGSR